MADIDLKSETPDTSVDINSVIIGADSQSATTPSVFGLSTIWTFLNTQAATWSGLQTFTGGVEFSGTAPTIDGATIATTSTAQTFTNKTLTAPDATNVDVTDGALQVGVDDDTPGIVSVYGGGTGEAGGKIRVYNDADNDGTNDYFEIEASGGKFQVGADGTPDVTIDASGNVGIGTTSPDGTLHVHSGSAGSVTAHTEADDLVVENSTSGGLSILAPDANQSNIYFGSPSDSVAALLRWQHSTLDFTVGSAIAGGELVFRTSNSVEAMRIDGSGNVGIGGTTAGASSAGNLTLFNGTAPTGSATNGVILYSEDVTASAELKVRDEAGNITTLSPHNFELIPEGPSEDMAWSYYSEKDGKAINIDMLKAIRVLEELSGEKLVHEKDV